MFIVVVENEETPNVPLSVVVAVSPPERPEFVPQANPLTVDDALPSTAIEPFMIIEELATELGIFVVTVGIEDGDENSQPVLLPTFVECDPAYHVAPPVTVLLAMLI
jgi:hypothetical protein